MIDTDHAGRHDVRACVGGHGRSLQRVLKMSGNSIRNNTSGQVYRLRTALVNDVFVRNVGSSSKMSRAVLRSIGIHAARVGSSSKMSRAVLRSIGIHAARGQDGGCLGLFIFMQHAARTVGVLVWSWSAPVPHRSSSHQGPRRRPFGSGRDSASDARVSWLKSSRRAPAPRKIVSPCCRARISRRVQNRQNRCQLICSGRIGVSSFVRRKNELTPIVCCDMDVALCLAKK